MDLEQARKRGRERLKMWSVSMRIFPPHEFLALVGIRPQGKTRRIRKKRAKVIMAHVAMRDIWDYALDENTTIEGPVQ